MTDKIFGYDWTAIQAAQAGGRLVPPMPTDEERTARTTANQAEARRLLAIYGEAELRALGYPGALDILERLGLLAGDRNV